MAAPHRGSCAVMRRDDTDAEVYVAACGVGRGIIIAST